MGILRRRRFEVKKPSKPEIDRLPSTNPWQVLLVNLLITIERQIPHIDAKKERKESGFPALQTAIDHIFAVVKHQPAKISIHDVLYLLEQHKFAVNNLPHAYRPIEKYLKHWSRIEYCGGNMDRALQQVNADLNSHLAALKNKALNNNELIQVINDIRFLLENAWKIYPQVMNAVVIELAPQDPAAAFAESSEELCHRQLIKDYSLYALQLVLPPSRAFVDWRPQFSNFGLMIQDSNWQEYNPNLMSDILLAEIKSIKLAKVRSYSPIWTRSTDPDETNPVLTYRLPSPELMYLQARGFVQVQKGEGDVGLWLADLESGNNKEPSQLFAICENDEVILYEYMGKITENDWQKKAADLRKKLLDEPARVKQYTGDQIIDRLMRIPYVDPVSIDEKRFQLMWEKVQKLGTKEQPYPHVIDDSDDDNDNDRIDYADIKQYVPYIRNLALWLGRDYYFCFAGGKFVISKTGDQVAIAEDAEASLAQQALNAQNLHTMQMIIDYYAFEDWRKSFKF